MDYDAIVVGGGIIGLTIARRLGQAGHRVAVLEAERALGQHASSRNSEVVHAGIYYTPGSLKARTCREGRVRLLEYCAMRAIRTRTPGKYIVACDDHERSELEHIARRAAANGVMLQWCEGAQVRVDEPAVHCTAALFSPTTAIVDSHALVAAVAGDVRDAGGDLVVGCRFDGATRRPGGLDVVAGDARVSTRLLFLAAGARSPQLATKIEGFAPLATPTGRFAKGNYFRLAGGPRFTHLVYPVPSDGGLGIHVTLDLEGNARLGPDVQWTAGLDYDVDATRASQFAAAARRYAPGIEDEALCPDYAGVRAKIVGPGEPAADFVVSAPADHGVDGVVALFGIESPGLTAAFALADHAIAAVHGAGSGARGLLL